MDPFKIFLEIQSSKEAKEVRECLRKKLPKEIDEMEKIIERIKTLSEYEVKDKAKLLANICKKNELVYKISYKMNSKKILTALVDESCQDKYINLVIKTHKYSAIANRRVQKLLKCSKQ
jgi:hypothetical protein